MADQLQRIASPLSASLSSSPGRPSSFSSRPHWPWSTYTHRNSNASVHSTTSTSSQSLHSSLDPRLSTSATSTPLQNISATWQSQSLLTQNLAGSYLLHQEETMRQWSFIGFEWLVRDVNKLRNFVEGVPEADASESTEQSVTPCRADFELLRETPELGDGRFNLEVAAHAKSSEAQTEASKASQLLVLVTSLMLDDQHIGYEIPASLMVAIKCQDDRVGERGARAGKWIWEHWQNDWSFREGSEVWECPLPPLSSLLENQKIAATDSFILCVQIHSPTGPFIPQQPQSYYVPRELLEGLENLLDSANTGDVKFVCLQRLPSEQPPSPIAHSTSSLVSPASASGRLARKRVIWAHSDILSQRSDYFATMLGSTSFSEAASVQPEGRKIHTVIVEEADFETTYWLLKFCYANYLKFKDVDDPRLAIEGIGAGWNTKWLAHDAGEWDWKPILPVQSEENLNADSRSATSGEGSESVQSAQTSTVYPSMTSSPSMARTSTATRPAQPAAKTSPSSVRTIPSATASRRSAGSSTMSADARSKPIPISTSKAGYSTGHYPLSPHSQRQMSIDPHPHPTPEPEPASALAMYIVAHRYTMPNLATLALEHMMSTITPQTSFALLLASSMWEEIQTIVEDYVVEKWDQVSVSTGFETCCAEVAAGEWGPEGGRIMTKLFRRLRSPSVMGPVRA